MARLVLFCSVTTMRKNRNKVFLEEKLTPFHIFISTLRSQGVQIFKKLDDAAVHCFFYMLNVKRGQVMQV